MEFARERKRLKTTLWTEKGLDVETAQTNIFAEDAAQEPTATSTET
jgi:hypothetical protein